ncbi:hypothetical protein NDU88_006334 [Pleurodeles waltl]|uniref:Uncharacterized protein n=1 Tax=Pleurodeles waltl TaxID=8319 RepID=A0AAV7SPJ7_PLEWA|nr:hypothetical protein NDU88_006334 [Pleurodeles waltl]
MFSDRSCRSQNSFPAVPRSGKPDIGLLGKGRKLGEMAQTGEMWRQNTMGEMAQTGGMWRQNTVGEMAQTGEMWRQDTVGEMPQTGGTWRQNTVGEMAQTGGATEHNGGDGTDWWVGRQNTKGSDPCHLVCTHFPTRRGRTEPPAAQTKRILDGAPGAQAGTCFGALITGPESQHKGAPPPGGTKKSQDACRLRRRRRRPPVGRRRAGLCRPSPEVYFSWNTESKKEAKPAGATPPSFCNDHRTEGSHPAPK